MQFLHRDHVIEEITASDGHMHSGTGDLVSRHQVVILVRIASLVPTMLKDILFAGFLKTLQ